MYLLYVSSRVRPISKKLVFNPFRYDLLNEQMTLTYAKWRYITLHLESGTLNHVESTSGLGSGTFIYVKHTFNYVKLLEYNN